MASATKITSADKTQTAPYEENAWNAQDATEYKKAINDNAQGLDELAQKVEELPEAGELPELAPVATTGQYNDLLGKPTIPAAYTNEQAVNANTLAIQQASTADRDRANHTGLQTAASISDFREAVQDAVAALLGAGSNITLTYDDENNTFTIQGAAAGTSFDPEATRDAIGAALIGVGNISVAINDAGDTITLSTTATQNSTDAQLRDRGTHTGTQDASTITGLTKSSVGLANVDNTSDLAKPVSTAQATAISQAGTAARDRANHTGTQTSTTISDFTEAVQDAVAGFLGAGSNITVTYNDDANTFTIAAAGPSQFDPEATRDAIGAALIGVGNISVVINDAADTITISTTATQNSTDAQLRDRSTHTGTQAPSTIVQDANNRFTTDTERQAVGTIKIPGAYNTRAGLARWRRALGLTGKLSTGAGLGGIDVEMWGDSVLEGYNSTNPSFDSFAHRFKVMLQQRLNPSGVVGGYGYMNFAKGGTNEYNTLVTRFGTLGTANGVWSVKGRPLSAAPGANGLYVTLSGAADATLRTAVTDVQYIGYQFSGYGNARWDVNPTTVGAAGIGTGTQTGTHNQLVSSNFHSGNRFGTATTPGFTQRITGLVPSATNVVQWAAPDTTGNAAYDGIIAYNGDFTCGVRCHDLAVFGTTVQQQLGFIRDGYGGGAGSFVTWGQGLLTGGACNSKLVLFNFISNDCGYAATPAVSLATFTSVYGQAIDYKLAQPSQPSVLLIIPPMANDLALVNRTTVGERYQDYVDAVYALADARQNVAVFDLNKYLGASAGLLADHVHPNDSAHVAIAHGLFQILA
jgi:hypothetical protein